MRKVKPGQPITDSTKGSLEYAIYEVDRAFRAQFGFKSWDYFICDTCSDHIILRDWELPQDEYWLVNYTHTDDVYTFDAQTSWERVQLGYDPVKNPVPPEVAPAGDGMATDMGDRARISRRAFVESRGPIMLLDSTMPSGARRVRGIGMSADSINDNMRRYPAPVIADAVKRAQAQLSNPAGRIGRGPLMGEAEHPRDKGERRALWLNTVFVWDSIEFDGKQVLLEGYIVPTSQGQDAITLLEHNVIPGLSTRSYGRSVLLKESGAIVEELLEMEFAGYDATIEPADMTAEMAFSDARRAAAQEDPMRRGFAGDRRLREPDRGTNVPGSTQPPTPAPMPDPVPTPAPAVAPVAPIADSSTGLTNDDRARLDRLAESERRDQVGQAIDQALADSPYNPTIRQQIADAVRGLNLATVEAVPAAVERQRAVADGFLAEAQLQLMGRPSPRGPVISGGGGNTQLVPEYAKAQQAITDSLVRATFKPSNLSRIASPRTVNERFAAEYLRRFDAAYKHHLIAESRMFADAEQASDLNLPYTVARTIIAEMLPTLVSTSLFDVQSVDPAPVINLPYETWANETGLLVTAAAEVVVSTNPINQWFAVANKFLTPGSVVVKDVTDAITYVEGTDYVLDIMGGRLMVITGSAIAAGATIHATYTASAIASGEMQPIQRGKMTLAFFPLTMMAERLGTQISSEAIVFSRAAIGYDATGRALNRLIIEIGRYIDAGLLQLALAEALRVASNSGGTWTAATDTYDDLAALIGVAKVKISNRFFEVNGVVMSETNSDRLGNWNGFTQAGQRPGDDLMGNGFVGHLKGQPVFATTQFTDSYIMPINREVVYYRIGQPLQIKGPFPSYDPAGSGKMVAADQYYVEQFAAATGDPSHSGKASTVKIA